MLFIARGNPFQNPSLDQWGGNRRRLASMAPAIQAYQCDLYLDAACSAVELCVNPDEHRASYAYKQINQAGEKRVVCEMCETLRREYLKSKGDKPPIKTYDFSDKGAANERH